MTKILTVKKQGEKKVLFEQDVLDESIISVGNNPSATFELKDAGIAPEQFVIITENDQMLLMNRADGTIINGEPLDLGSKIELHEGDKIEIGNFQMFLTSNETNGSQEVSNGDVEEVQTAEITESQTTEKKDFSAVLNSLKEEDSFYFQIINEENVVERVVYDSEEIWLGTSFAEVAVKKDKEELDEIYARVQKDWSGAVIYPEDTDEIYLNGEFLNEPSRLKNDDELILVDEFAEDGETPTKITFHEPVVLLALNSILPEDLPEPVKFDSALESAEIENFDDETDLEETQTLDKKASKPKKKRRRIFGYFSILEIFIMAIGTLVTAAIIFLVLEFV